VNITTVDTNVLLDVLDPGSPYGTPAQEALDAACRTGRLCICDVVRAELAANFALQESAPEDALSTFLERTRLRHVPMDPISIDIAGVRWAAHTRRRPTGLQCPQCGSINPLAPCVQCGHAITIRQHVIADFLIGAWAVTHGRRLLTRDRGYYRTYFPELVLIDPTAPHPAAK
jgi:predicted nucleic acid-binding protein